MISPDPNAFSLIRMLTAKAHLSALLTFSVQVDANYNHSARMHTLHALWEYMSTKCTPSYTLICSQAPGYSTTPLGFTK